MNLFNKIVEWFNTKQDFAYSLIRIILGVALFVRGLILLSDPAAISELAGQKELYWWYSYITIIHIIAGLLLTLGLLTRISALLQIPILIGAVFFIHMRQGLVTEGQSLELSVLVLVLLIIYFVFGPGSLSLDNFFAKRKSTLKSEPNPEVTA
jgi:uncharacterized membrane protein YphA (DoxX/SURF4 family)